MTTEDVNVRPDRGGPRILIHGPWPRPLTLTVGAALQLGRLPDNDGVLPGGLVSRHHAVVVWSAEDARPTLEDLGSANGVVVDGTPAKPGQPVPLADGAVVELGGHRLGIGRPAPAVTPPAGVKTSTPAPTGGSTIAATHQTERLPRQQPGGRSEGIGYINFRK